jgi:hypothetical protein
MGAPAGLFTAATVRADLSQPVKPRHPLIAVSLQPGAVESSDGLGCGPGGGKGRVAARGASKPPAQLSDTRRYAPRPRFPWVPAILISVLLIGGGTFIGTRLTRRPLPTPTSAPLQAVPVLPERRQTPIPSP